MRIPIATLLWGSFLCSTSALAQQVRWHLSDDGGISWEVAAHDIHTDHIEMSGKGIAAIVTYGTGDRQELILRQQLIFPSLRTIPNDTRGSLSILLQEHIADSILADGQPLRETPVSFYIRGFLRIKSRTQTPLTLERSIFPSTDKRAYLESYRLTNTGHSPIHLHLPITDTDSTTDARKGADGAYIIRTRTYEGGDLTLEAGASTAFSLVISARKATEETYTYSAAYEEERRKAFVEEQFRTLILRTPDDTLNRMFAFAKIRTAESIYDTRAGLMHGPGGGQYYAAIWANDQAEYVDPFFPFLGYAAGNESARNSFRLFASYMNPEYKPIPSSIVAEGAGYWNGAGDRGDEAMIAYGAARFALAYADTIEARRLWPLIEWCLEYLRRKETPAGVIASQSDELEGRFPSGKINLSTNILAYGGFLYASRLAAALGKTSEASQLSSEAEQLKTHIAGYFQARVQGFETYRYYEGNTILRSWICLPLVMGIFDRAPATIKALLSPYLWTQNGILTAAGDSSFWDRATLYAFRGLFYAGETDTSLRYFAYYSRTRLLGEHVPYAVEAWPEGDQRQLSAESGLYCRAVTEGLFGIDPLGFRQFSCTPRLPAGWQDMSLQHIRAFGGDVGIDVRAEGEYERITVTDAGRTVREILWDKKDPVIIDLAAQQNRMPAVSFYSTDTALAHAFEWAKDMALHYRGKDEDPVGPWYESALRPRDAFCMRDVSHQSVGAEILGLTRENKNMLALFAGNISAAKNWCSYWEMNKWGKPAPEDYRSDSEFWYNLNANFDVLYACWRLSVFTGDSAYISDPVFTRFMARSAGPYIDEWVLAPDSLLTRPGHPNAPVNYREEDAFDRCRGLPSYSEGIHNLKMGVDLVAALYRGLMSYASIVASKGDAPLADLLRRKAEQYRLHLERDWWDEKAGLYNTYYSNDGHFGKNEGETFLLWFDALQDSARKERTLAHLAAEKWNMENTSYLPYLFYQQEHWDQARDHLLYVANPATPRRQYPEVSFGVVEGIVQGLMGVSVLPGTRTITTLYRQKDGSESSLKDLPILQTTLSLRHEGSKMSVLTNSGSRPVLWRAQFAGSYSRARVGNATLRLKKGMTPGGKAVSYIDMAVPPNGQVQVKVF